MIIMKSTQDKVLAALQATLDIIERRFELPVFNKVLISSAGTNPARQKPAASNQLHQAQAVLKAFRRQATPVIPGNVGFFSATKANLRNAP